MLLIVSLYFSIMEVKASPSPAQGDCIKKSDLLVYHKGKMVPVCRFME
jgi:hypothetical protein